MSSARQLFAELTALTKSFIVQEYLPNERLPTDSETYHYFRNCAIASYGNKAQESPQVKASPPRNLPPTPMVAPKAPAAKAPEAAPQQNSPPQPARSPVKRVPLPKQADIAPAAHAEPKAKLHGDSEGKFTLAPPATPKPPNFDEVRKIIKEKLPHLSIVEAIPDDAEGRLQARLWEQKATEPGLIILSFQESPSELAFLNNIAKTLNIYGISSQVVAADTIDNDFKSVQFLMGSLESIEKMPNLQKHLKTSDEKYFIGDVPLLLMSPASTYLIDPTLKASLWKTIINI